VHGDDEVVFHPKVDTPRSDKKFEYLKKTLPFNAIIIGTAELVKFYKTSKVDAVVIGA
jgi:hypothetical protein